MTEGMKKTQKTKQEATGEKRPKKSGQDKISGEEHYRKVQEAAYLMAEKDGFQQGKELEYWLAAEKQIQEALDRR